MPWHGIHTSVWQVARGIRPQEVRQVLTPVLPAPQARREAKRMQHLVHANFEMPVI